MKTARAECMKMSTVEERIHSLNGLVYQNFQCILETDSMLSVLLMIIQKDLGPA